MAFCLEPIPGPDEILNASCKGVRPHLRFDNSTGIVLAILGSSGNKTGIADSRIAPKVCFISWRTKKRDATDNEDDSDDAGRYSRRRSHRQHQDEVVLTAQGSTADSKFYVNDKIIEGKSNVIDLAHNDELALGKGKKHLLYRYRVVVVGQQTDVKLSKKRRNSTVEKAATSLENKRRKSIVDENEADEKMKCGSKSSEKSTKNKGEDSEDPKTSSTSTTITKKQRQDKVDDDRPKATTSKKKQTKEVKIPKLATNKLSMEEVKALVVGKSKANKASQKKPGLQEKQGQESEMKKNATTNIVSDKVKNDKDDKAKQMSISKGKKNKTAKKTTAKKLQMKHSSKSPVDRAHENGKETEGKNNKSKKLSEEKKTKNVVKEMNAKSSKKKNKSRKKREISSESMEAQQDNNIISSGSLQPVFTNVPAQQQLSSGALPAQIPSLLEMAEKRKHAEQQKLQLQQLLQEQQLQQQQQLRQQQDYSAGLSNNSDDTRASLSALMAGDMTSRQHVAALQQQQLLNNAGLRPFQQQQLQPGVGIGPLEQELNHLHQKIMAQRQHHLLQLQQLRMYQNQLEMEQSLGGRLGGDPFQQQLRQQLQPASNGEAFLQQLQQQHSSTDNFDTNPPLGSMATDFAQQSQSPLAVSVCQDLAAGRGPSRDLDEHIAAARTVAGFSDRAVGQPSLSALQQQQSQQRGMQSQPQFYDLIKTKEIPGEWAECFLGKGKKEAPFPLKLHQILANPEFSSYICWDPSGKSWRVLNPFGLEKFVIPIFFRHSKFASFMRQVNGWNFRREKGWYKHDMFVRHDVKLCFQMKRLPRNAT